MLSEIARFRRFGRPEEALEIEREEPAPPGPGQLLARMLQAPINPSDLIPIGGAYRHRIALPGIAGYEGVGVVEAVGPGAPPSLLGRRVLPLRGEGTWQTYVKAPAELAVPVPDFLEDDAACQLYINPLTAWLACREALGLRPGDAFAVNACGSALGRVFAQLSAVFGYRLIAIARDSRHAEELLSLGAWRTVDTSPRGFSLREAVLDLTGGRGVEAAVDSIGGEDGTELALCVRPGGVLLRIGLLSGIPADESVARERGVNARPFWLRQWAGGASAERWHAAFRELIGLAGQGRLRMAPIAARFPLRDVKEAVRLAPCPGRSGKVLLDMRLP
ncbi:alcohol dehydrogenase [Cohnella xylanilytica]|uniref:Zinc-dependent alcohol dehydrogenase family protein n=1 Tax=Cohnella xylanilytica TaxID=557555 RepID=A0A841U183_9BACL|nr:zinc-dependent alcohol dehydrogenase family protein [Cohnella xylanilytica]MBB6691871.1 zinc-dependent alcohol dehydrogenase family protein [Cohnella xylanilytica]GIO16176.1 alcohol dehydrogenase [Cohnella xylanilytica]